MSVGKLQLLPVSAGTFVARPRYFDSKAAADARPDVFDHDGAAWWPIGCFIVPTGDRLVLVDAGLSPELQHLPDDMLLVGGQLPTGLRAAGIIPGEVTDVVCTHLHADHVGWLFDQHADPVFPDATIWLGAEDWDHFVDGPGEMAAHIEAGFRRCSRTSGLCRLTQDTPVADGVAAVMTPRHTPGHLCVEVETGGKRVLLLGDAITSPVQLEEPVWHSMGDVDHVLAEQSRQRLCRRLANWHTVGVGAHFPELQPGHLATRGWQPLLSR